MLTGQMEDAVAEIFITSFFSSFFLVRLLKGSWLRQPVYLALGIVGALGGLISSMILWPGSENDWIAGNAAALIGVWLLIALYDRFIGSVAE